MKLLNIIAALFLSVNLFGQIEIKSHFLTTGDGLSSNRNDSLVIALDGVDSVATEWQQVKNFQFFNLFAYLTHDGTTFTSSLDGDVIDLEIRYELSPNNDLKYVGKPYIDKSTGAKKLIMSFADTDTTAMNNNYGFYESLNATASFAISPSAYIRFWIIVGTNQLQDIDMVLFLLRQS